MIASAIFRNAAANASGDKTGRRIGSTLQKTKKWMSGRDAEIQRALKGPVMKVRLADMRLSREIGLKEIAAFGLEPVFFPVAAEELEGWPRYKTLIWRCFEQVPNSNRTPRFTTIMICWVFLLVIVSSLVAVLETVPPWCTEHPDLWEGLEWFFSINFTVEFGLRFISCPDLQEFMCAPSNWIDAAVVIPFWVEKMIVLAMGGSSVGNLTFIRLLRLGKGIRLIKLGKYSRGVKMLENSLTNAADAFRLFIGILILTMVLCSSFLYFAEKGEYIYDAEGTGSYYRQYDDTMHGVMPELVNSTCEYTVRGLTVNEGNSTACLRKISPYQSVPQTFFFVIVTLMTVGYGDVAPITYTGKLAGVLTLLLGIIALVLPLSIIQSSFVDERRRMKAESTEEKDYLWIRNVVEASIHMEEEDLRDRRERLRVSMLAAFDFGCMKLQFEYWSQLVSVRKRSNSGYKLPPLDSGKSFEEQKGEDDTRLEVEAYEEVVEEMMLRPTMVTLKQQLELTEETVPSIQQDCLECLALLEKVKLHTAEYEDDMVEREASQAPGSSTQVHPDSGDCDLPTRLGSRLTGKQYMVPEEEVQKIYTLLRRTMLSSIELVKSWSDAKVKVVVEVPIRTRANTAVATPRIMRTSPLISSASPLITSGNGTGSPKLMPLSESVPSSADTVSDFDEHSALMPQ